MICPKKCLTFGAYHLARVVSVKVIGIIYDFLYDIVGFKTVIFEIYSYFCKFYGHFSLKTVLIGRSPREYHLLHLKAFPIYVIIIMPMIDLSLTAVYITRRH